MDISFIETFSRRKKSSIASTTHYPDLFHRSLSAPPRPGPAPWSPNPLLHLRARSRSAGSRRSPRPSLPKGPDGPPQLDLPRGVPPQGPRFRRPPPQRGPRSPSLGSLVTRHRYHPGPPPLDSRNSKATTSPTGAQAGAGPSEADRGRNWRGGLGAAARPPASGENLKLCALPARRGQARGRRGMGTCARRARGPWTATPPWADPSTGDRHRTPTPIPALEIESST